MIDPVTFRRINANYFTLDESDDGGQSQGDGGDDFS